MADEIEKAYSAVLAENGKAPLPDADSLDRRMLFIAISRGVINHLQKKQLAITIVIAAGRAIPGQYRARRDRQVERNNACRSPRFPFRFDGRAGRRAPPTITCGTSSSRCCSPVQASA